MSWFFSWPFSCSDFLCYLKWWEWQIIFSWTFCGIYYFWGVVVVVARHSLNFLICIVDPPSIKINRKEVIVVEGHNTSLTCNVSGKPEPTITWTKQGSGVVLSNTSSWDVLNVSRHDATDDIIQYQCKASNGVGTPAAATVNVTVYCKYYRFICYH